jgi:hypothetical protein
MQMGSAISHVNSRLPEWVNIWNPQLPVNGRCTFPGLTPDKTYKIVTTGETRQRDMRGSEIWVAQSRETLIKTPLGVDSPTTIVLGISNLTTSSVLAACNIIDLDGATGTCTLSGWPWATSWAIWADKSLTELSDGITYTLTVDGIKKVKNANNTLTDVVVHQVVTFTTIESSDTTPDAFTFTSQTGSQRSATVDSASVNITGINQPTSVSVTNWLVSINGGAFVTSGTISNGQSLVTRVTTSDSYNTPTTATVTVGWVNSTFTATTLANGTPTLPVVSDVNVIVGTAWSVVLPVGSDTAWDTLTYSLWTLPTGFSFNATTRTLSWTGTTAPATTNVSYTVTDQWGLSSTPQNVKIVVTSAPDTTPDAFTFTSQTGSQRSATVDSASVNITGINQPTSVSVTNWLVSINGGAFVTSGTISNGQSLVTRVTTSDSYNTPTTATVTVGWVNSTFTATTLANGTPTLPVVSDVNVIVGTAWSVVLPVGSDTAWDTLTYSLWTLPTGFSFNATTRTLSWTGTTAPATTNVSYTVTDQWGLSSTPQNVKIVVTSAPDTTPDAFTFTSQTGSQRSATVDSASVNITGINQPTSVSVTNWLVSINGGAFVTSGTISNGQSLVTRVTTSDSYNTPTTATVTVGWVNSTFTATTLANGTPTLPVVSDVNVIVGTAWSVVLPVGSDTAWDTLTYSLWTLPTGFSFNATTRTLSWTGTTAPATTNVSYTVTDQWGLSSTPQNVKIVVTSAPDTTPDAFTFTSQTGSQRSATVDSASVNITGINQPTSVSVTNWLVSINGGAFVTSGTISNGQSLVTRVTTSDSYNTPTTATVTVGWVNSTFTATTLANGTPTLPVVSDVNVIVGTAWSVVLPVGSDTAWDTLTYSLWTLPTGFSFNATTRTLSWTGTTAPATTNVSYTVTDQWGLSSTPQNVKIVVTSAPDTTPDAFTFTSQTGSQRSATVDSASVNITGINQPTSVSVTNWLVSINGGAFVTSGTISNGQSLVTRVTTSDSYNTPTTATVTVGWVNSTFTATTLANGTPTLPVVSDVNVIVGTAWSVVLPVGSDTAWDTLTYSLWTLPTGFSFNATTRTLSWTGTTAPATTNVSYTVTDQWGLSSTPQNVKIVVTSAPDTTPDAFTFTSQTGSQRSATVDSASVNITGINQPTSVSVTNWLVSINGGAFVTSGTISNGQSLVTRVTTSDSYNTPTTATVTVGWVNSTFTATTLANGTPTLPVVSDVNVIVGTAWSVVLPVGSDTAWDTLTYSLWTLPTGFSFNATTRTLSWTGTTAPATTNVSYTVTDQWGLSSTPQNVKIVVNAPANTTDPQISYGSIWNSFEGNLDLQPDGSYNANTWPGPNTISGLIANDPEGIGSYSVVSSLFGTLLSGTGIPPSSVISGNTVWLFNQTETITITVTDNWVPPRTSTKDIVIHYIY